MRRGWNGITISRDTIHIEGMTLGFERPVLFERHAVGGEYAAGWKMVGKGVSTINVIDMNHMLTSSFSLAVCQDHLHP